MGWLSIGFHNVGGIGSDLHDGQWLYPLSASADGIQLHNGEWRRLPNIATKDPPYSCIGVHGDRSIRVRLRPDNVRELYLADHPGFVQSFHRCAGVALAVRPPPGSSCDDLALKAAWRCRAPLIRSADITWYAKKFLDRVLPKCEKEPIQALMLGLGGGTLQSYLKAKCPKSELVTVENNSGVVAAARSFFGFTGDVIVKDASSALQNLAGKRKRFDIVIVDICDTVLSKRDWKNLHSLLAPNGLVLHNHTDSVKMKAQLLAFKAFFGDDTTQSSATKGNVVVVGHARKAIAEPDASTSAVSEPANEFDTSALAADR